MVDEHASSSSSHIFTRFEYLPNDVDKDQLIFPGINETFKFKKKDLVYKHIIGSSVHTVHRYVFTPLSRDIAIKKIPIPCNPSSHVGKKKVQEEREKLRKLAQEIRNFRILSTHPHIVDFYGLCLHEGYAWLCMEIMDFSLREVYQKVHEAFETMLATIASFPENIIGVIAIRIIDALSFCQSKGIMHRDVKPDNILLNGKGKVKLCDFGVSKQIEGLTTTFAGTLAYMPPERLKMPKFFQLNPLQPSSPSSQYVQYEYRSDVWSVGITLAEIAYGRLPYILNQKEKYRLYINLQNRISKTKPKALIDRCFGTKYSQNVKDFVMSCLDNIDTRPTFDKLKLKDFYVMNLPNDNDHFIADFILTYFRRNTDPLSTPVQVSHHTSTLTEMDYSVNTSEGHGVLCETDVKKATPPNSLELKSTAVSTTKNGITPLTQNFELVGFTTKSTEDFDSKETTTPRKRVINAQDVEDGRSNKTKLLCTQTFPTIVTQINDAKNNDHIKSDAKE